MFRTDSGGGGNHPQSAEQARQPLPNHSEDRSNSATGSAAVSGQSSSTGWRAELQRLEPLNLPLLPCGADSPDTPADQREYKAPINHRTGQLLTGWPSARFTVPQILAMNGVVRSVGTRTGDGCLCFDIDGGTAIELALEHGCDPQQANTWQVHRTTDPLRLKVLFSLTPEQQQQLGKVTSKAHTREADKNDQGEVIRKGEALELFHHTGRQVILLGEHPSSAGQYIWPDGQGPEALAPIPDCWWQLALQIAAGELGITPASAARPSRKATSSSGWKPINPCPICGRNTTSWCTYRPDNGSINCRHGSTFSPVISHGILKPGQTITGTNGVTYAFTGDSLQADGHTLSSFVVHKPRQQQRKPEQQAHASAGSAAGTQTKPTPEGIKACLRQEISEGISEANLATLITTLSLESDIHASTIQQVANRLKDEHRRKLEVQAEAQAIAAEADRQELGQALTPAYILPPAIAAAIQIRTRYLPCDGPSAVLPFLTAAAGLVKLGTQVQASAAAGYSVPINLFACLVGKSGAMKSPVGRLTVEAPTQELQAELARANQLDHSQWEETCKELKKGEPRPAKPRPKRLKVSDFTGEALADQLQTQEAHGLGLLIHRDELSGLFGSLNAYRGGKGGDEQQLLELFDGGGLNSLRVMGDRHYSRSQVSIYGSTQPDVLRQLVAEGDASGLWARFLFVPLPERPVQLPITTSVAEVAEVDAAAETLAKVCRSIYAMPPQTYHLSPAAAEQFARYHYSRQQAALAAATGAESALYGKSAGKVLRVAGVLHLLQIATGQASNSDRIEPPTIDRATTLVDHLDAWALSFHAEVAAGGIGQLMRTVHTASEAAAGPVRWTDLQRRLSKAQRKEIDSAAVADAMQALTAAGYGEVEQLRNGGLSYRALRPLP